MVFWTFFTKLADTTVMMPLALMLTVWLAYAKRFRAAICWSFLFGAGLCLVAASKVAYVGWGIGIASLDFTGFSGHAMRATAVAPILFYLILQSRTKSTVRITLALAIAFGVAIAVSRLILHEHSVSEVVSGLLVGGAVSFGFLRLIQTQPVMPLNKVVVAACIIILIPGLLAKPAPTQLWIERVALYLSGHDKPYRHRHEIVHVEKP